ncbi:MAG: hypothetical protein ACK5AL_17585, partial [Planctomycetota bacterium]
GREHRPMGIYGTLLGRGGGPSRSLRHGTRADPVRGFAAGAKPTTGGESVDSPRIGGELPDVKTRAGRCSLS